MMTTIRTLAGLLVASFLVLTPLANSQDYARSVRQDHRASAPVTHVDTGANVNPMRAPSSRSNIVRPSTSRAFRNVPGYNKSWRGNRGGRSNNIASSSSGSSSNFWCEANGDCFCQKDLTDIFGCGDIDSGGGMEGHCLDNGTVMECNSTGYCWCTISKNSWR